MKKLIIASIITLVALFASEFILIHSDHHGHTPWWHLKGISILFGILSGICLMLGAKALGNFFLYRAPDYYETKNAGGKGS